MKFNSPYAEAWKYLITYLLRPPNYTRISIMERHARAAAKEAAFRGSAVRGRPPSPPPSLPPSVRPSLSPPSVSVSLSALMRQSVS